MRLWDLRSAEQLVRCPLPEARPLRFSRDGRFVGPGLDGASAWSLGGGRGRRVPIAARCRGRRGEELVARLLGRDGVLASAGDDGRAPGGPGGDGGGVRRPAWDRGNRRGSRRVFPDHKRSDRSAPLASPAIGSGRPPGWPPRAIGAAGRPSHRAGSRSAATAGPWPWSSTTRSAAWSSSTYRDATLPLPSPVTRAWSGWTSAPTDAGWPRAPGKATG